MYNDFTGGFTPRKEILVQAITSLGRGFGKPEEIAHMPLFFPDDTLQLPVIIQNLQHSALRIEKLGKKFRLLFSAGVMENAAFKEVVAHEFDFEPKYIGLFALQGFVNNTDIIPACFKSFSVDSNPCR